MMCAPLIMVPFPLLVIDRFVLFCSVLLFAHQDNIFVLLRDPTSKESTCRRHTPCYSSLAPVFRGYTLSREILPLAPHVCKRRPCASANPLYRCGEEASL